MTLWNFLNNVYVPGHLGMRESSATQLKAVVHLFDKWAGHHVEVNELSDELVLQFLSDYLKQRSPATVNTKRRGLLTMWRFAHEGGLIDRLPGKIPKASEYQRDPEGWSVEEFERILTQAQRTKGEIEGVPAGKWYLSLLLCLYDTGARVGAMLQVRPDEVYLAEGELLLRAEVQKTRRSRWCALSNQTIEACAPIWSPGRRRMWPWPWTRCWLSRQFCRILDRADVRYGAGKGGVFHKIRRTSGTLVEANGGDGSRHLGNTRQVFEQHYLDPRATRRMSLDKLPRPRLTA